MSRRPGKDEQSTINGKVIPMEDYGTMNTRKRKGWKDEEKINILSDDQLVR